jgi:hypothetical protein
MDPLERSIRYAYYPLYALSGSVLNVCWSGVLYWQQ